ncbi:glycosyltransferase family 9 protein [Agarivorans gilvus]|jgi:ADP-heptose:LPS heptosyltransferase|uniref:ADP-heptose--LPS heptosyltransferase II n=1 Tax=Agarivorans gilvus TaxID=680279 RepID=A0ABQ1I0D6_9ALTE|nr:glycosyltransferase family 9 protein [Agarivorans gilvus]GGB03730.1 ADP-heptose--LPS heptosyltransferase II [Agarivorans gilvus]
MRKLLVVRNDKIGDFMLAWPSFALLKQSLADCEITALVPSYTAPLAELCPWIDKVIVDCGSKADAHAQAKLLAQVKQQQFDAYLCLFSNMRNAWLGFRAGIKQRCAPATKLAQLLFNQRVKQRRSQSRKPESEYNLDLTRAFLAQHGVARVEPKPPYFQFADAVLSTRKVEEFGQFAEHLLVMVHIGSGGSANNLSSEQYFSLIDCLAKLNPALHFVITAGPGEQLAAQELVNLLDKEEIPNQLYFSEKGLKTFCEVLACADLFIAGSTGPLHIAGALDVPTVGFFPSRRSATPLRWRPLNSEGRHIAFSPPAGELTQEDMSLINVSDCAVKVNNWWKKLAR